MACYWGVIVVDLLTCSSEEHCVNAQIGDVYNTPHATSSSLSLDTDVILVETCKIYLVYNTWLGMAFKKIY